MYSSKDQDEVDEFAFKKSQNPVRESPADRIQMHTLQTDRTQTKRVREPVRKDKHPQFSMVMRFC